jgi:hypothetical protein
MKKLFLGAFLAGDELNEARRTDLTAAKAKMPG